MSKRDHSEHAEQGAAQFHGEGTRRLANWAMNL